jgi:thioredoxin 1
MSQSSHLECFTDDNFDDRVLRSDLPVLVDFSADWCPPCRILEPVIEKLAEDYAGRLRVGTSDVDQNADVATRYQIHHLPTMLVFRSGRIVAQVVGALPRHRLDELLATVV